MLRRGAPRACIRQPASGRPARSAEPWAIERSGEIARGSGSTQPLDARDPDDSSERGKRRRCRACAAGAAADRGGATLSPAGGRFASGGEIAGRDHRAAPGDPARPGGRGIAPRARPGIVAQRPPRRGNRHPGAGDRPRRRCRDRPLSSGGGIRPSGADRKGDSGLSPGRRADARDGRGALAACSGSIDE